MDSVLSSRIKQHAFELGADLVGVANLERYANAPIRMSPQGIFPEAKSVLVCALHHPDGCIEMGGRTHPQDVGPYAVQYWMNSHLDQISYLMARFLEDQGYEAIPIASSNIWRYRPFKDLTAIFSPDMSHIYSAVAAGLSELGYHGISMTPEFGTRNRFVSIITTAPLDPEPLQPGNTLCDNCGQCIKHCLSGALKEEVDGTEDIVIEGHHYTKAKKNLWRCSWGEHFGVDLDLPKPEVVTEENIIEAVRQHGLRGGEMGSCLRHCLPAHLRQWDPAYTNAPRRKRQYTATGDFLPRWVQQKLQAAASIEGADFVLVQDTADLTAYGITATDHLPDAIRAVSFGCLYPSTEGKPSDELASAAHYQANAAANRGARWLEDLGYSVVVSCDWDPTKLRPVVADLVPEGWQALLVTVLTSAPLQPTSPQQAATQRPVRGNLTRLVKRIAREEIGVDAVGVAAASELTAIKPQLEAIFGGEETLAATNKGVRWLEFDADVTLEKREVRGPEDYLPGAQSVLMLGLRLPQATVERCAAPPAEVAGPYIFAQYVVEWNLRHVALRMVKSLREMGYRAEASLDLMGTGSMLANPRGLIHSAFCNRFAAQAAGLGVIGRGGFLINPDFGANLRTIAIVTDAPLTADGKLDPQCAALACGDCTECLSVCPVSAHSDPVTVQMNGQSITFNRLDQKRCDWSARYALVGDDGFKFLGSKINIAPPDEINPENLRAALQQFDTVQGHHRCGIESCVRLCPKALGKG